MKEEYKGFQIEINEVLDVQFDFDGFGWAYQVSKGSEPYFKVIIKAPFGKKDHDNVQSSYKGGMTKITSMIEMNNFEKGKTYCYKWVAISHPPEEVNCEDFVWNRE